MDPSISLPPNLPPPIPFRGGSGEVRLYSGADYQEHIQGVYHQNTFPSWQSDRIPFTIDVGSNGTAVYKIEYTDFEDLEIPHTVNAREDTTFLVGNGFDIEMDFNPDLNFQVDEVILNDYDKNDSLIASDTLTGITQETIVDYYNRDNYAYMKCFVTFEP